MCVFQLCVCPNKFCSVVCQPNSCSGITTNDCSTCASNFVKPTGVTECQIDTTGSWRLAFGTADVPNAPAQTAPQSSTTSMCDIYGIAGWFDANTVQLIDDSDVIPEPHYNVRILVWTIFANNFNTAKDLKVSMLFGTTPKVTRTISISKKNTNEKICLTGNKDQYYLRVDQTFTHNDTTVPIQWELATSESNSGSKYGFKQVHILYQPCHWACSSCWTDQVNNCWTCNQDFGMVLSLNTCNQTCLTGYGMTTLGIECILCDVKCSVCFDTATNCYECTASGPNAAFLNNVTCATTCPTGTFGNTTSRVCDACDPVCATCSNSISNCLSCAPTYGYSNFYCYNPCPDATFLATSGTNCTSCDPKCSSCSVSATNCQSCRTTAPNIAYLLTSTCYSTCPSPTFAAVQAGANVCLPCSSACATCTADPMPCQSCAATFYLYQLECLSACPDLYIADDTLHECLLCELACVNMNMTIGMCDPHTLCVDLVFTSPIDWVTFPYEKFQTYQIGGKYSIDLFYFNYTMTNSTSYQIKITPKGYAFYRDITVQVTTMIAPEVVHKSINNRPFKSVVYNQTVSISFTMLKPPQLDSPLITQLSTTSNGLSSIFTQPYVQQINKAGIFSFLFSGAQITSASVLVNGVAPVNMYEGVRFWAMFVYFDVPNWQQESTKEKNVLVPGIKSVVSGARLLFDINNVSWHFKRTGQSSFFLYDVYPQLCLIGLSWLLLGIGYLVLKTEQHKAKHLGKLYTFLHRCHEVSLFYIAMGTILEWRFFQSTSVQRISSLLVCIFVNIYYLLYSMKVYYALIPYSCLKPRSIRFQQFQIKYGCFLKNIRYERYDILVAPDWSFKLWLRPHNYHVLSFYKKLLMMVVMPLFYDSSKWQAGMLLTLQIVEMLRLWHMWPYTARWRNWYRMFLESLLFGFFCCVFAQSFLIEELMLDDPTSTSSSNSSIKWFQLGWAGFILVFLFNIGFLVMLIVDIVRGIRFTNSQMMEYSRKLYYYQQLKPENNGLVEANDDDNGNEEPEFREKQKEALKNPSFKKSTGTPASNPFDEPSIKIPGINLCVETWRISEKAQSPIGRTVAANLNPNQKPLYEIFVSLKRDLTYNKKWTDPNFKPYTAAKASNNSNQPTGDQTRKRSGTATSKKSTQNRPGRSSSIGMEELPNQNHQNRGGLPNGFLSSPILITKFIDKTIQLSQHGLVSGFQEFKEGEEAEKQAKLVHKNFIQLYEWVYRLFEGLKSQSHEEYSASLEGDGKAKPKDPVIRTNPEAKLVNLVIKTYARIPSTKVNVNLMGEIPKSQQDKLNSPQKDQKDNRLRKASKHKQEVQVDPNSIKPVQELSNYLTFELIYSDGAIKLIEDSQMRRGIKVPKGAFPVQERDYGWSL